MSSLSKSESSPDSETYSDPDSESTGGNINIASGSPQSLQPPPPSVPSSETSETGVRLLESAREAPDGTFDGGGLVFTMRPVYPLVARLERPWPVRVPAREFPVLLTPFSYNAATAWAALTTSLSLLAVGFVLSQALTLSFISSHSMEPTLQASRSFLLVCAFIQWCLFVFFVSFCFYCSCFCVLFVCFLCILCLLCIVNSCVLFVYSCV